MSMGTFATTKTYKVLRTLVKTFVFAALGIVVMFGDKVLDMKGSDWKAVLAAGIAAVALTSWNALNKNYPDYGIGSVKE